ncbi:metal-dependent hydrolase [Lysobacter brunescens]|uniref:Metal-dependent hydrolase n=1 Tax=Lysobacter brunescens TaxID=262323 RepID=A0ABW2YF72_9GAMM
MSVLMPTRSFRAPLQPDIPRNWLPANPALSALLDMYTVIVPSNEAFYMRTLARCLGRIDDPDLAAAGRAFIHQEAEHGVAHKRFWSVLDAHGYRYRRLERIIDVLTFRLTERIAPLSLRMSMVSCIEHINAFMAHEFLRQGILADAHPEVRAMQEWHFAEEIEHKSVSFDVLRAVSPGYGMRLAGWVPTTVLFYTLMTLGMLFFLAQDGGLWRASTWRGLWRHLGPEHGMARRTLKHLFAYLKPSFHPSQLDDRALAEAVIARYSSPQGGWLAPATRGSGRAPDLAA